MTEKRCYSIGEIQEILGICKASAYNLIKENQFRSILVGGKYRISKKSFDAWLDGEIEKEEPEHKEEKADMEREGKDEAQGYDLSALLNFGHHARRSWRAGLMP